MLRVTPVRRLWLRTNFPARHTDESSADKQNDKTNDMTTTTIEVTDQRLLIITPGFGRNTLYRVHLPDMWQWHEAVANAIANHHASAMGVFYPCPEPDADDGLECDECGDTQLVDDTGNGNPGWLRCACGHLHQHHQPDQGKPEPLVSTQTESGPVDPDSPIVPLKTGPAELEIVLPNPIPKTTHGLAEWLEANMGWTNE